MPRRRKDRRTLAEILESTSDVLFPAEFGEKHVNLSSRSEDGDTPLHVLLWRNDTNGAERLIEAGIDVNSVGDMGETPLHIAIRNENARAARALLQAGGKIDVRSEFGQTPQELLESASPEFTKLLDMKHGA